MCEVMVLDFGSPTFANARLIALARPPNFGTTLIDRAQLRYQLTNSRIRVRVHHPRRVEFLLYADVARVQRGEHTCVRFSISRRAIGERAQAHYTVAGLVLREP